MPGYCAAPSGIIGGRLARIEGFRTGRDDRITFNPGVWFHEDTVIPGVAGAFEGACCVVILEISNNLRVGRIAEFRVAERVVARILDDRAAIRVGARLCDLFFCQFWKSLEKQWAEFIGPYQVYNFLVGKHGICERTTCA